LIKKAGRLFKRSTWIAIETVVVIAILAGLIAGVAVWNLRAGPVDVSFAKNYIQEALTDPVRGTHATMDSVVLHWPDLNGPLLLGLKNGKILKANGDVIVSVDEIALALSKSHLLIGRIAPEAVILKAPHLRIVRTAQGDIDIGLSSSEADTAEEGDENLAEHASLAERILSYIAHPGNDADSSPLASLQSFEIEDAQLSVEDEIIQETWVVPHMNALIEGTATGLEAQISASLDFHVNLPAMSAPQSVFDEEFELLLGSFSESTTLQASLEVPWQGTDIKFQGQIDNLPLSNIGDKFPDLQMIADYDLPIDVKFQGSLDADFKPVVADISIVSDAGWVQIPEAYDVPLEYKDLLIDLRYQEEPRLLALKKARISVQDIALQMEAEVDIGSEKIAGPLRVKVARAEHARMKDLWPKFLAEDNSKEWIIDRLSDGTFYNAYASMNILAQKQTDAWSFDVEKIKAGFAFDDLSVDYRSPLTPAKKATGSGFFDYDADTLSIDIQKAMIDDMNVVSGKIDMARIIEKGAGTAAVNVKLEGPLASVFRYAEKEPIEQTQDFDVSAVTGQAKLDVNLSFPMTKDVKKEDVRVDITGVLENAFIPKVANNLDFSEGLLDLSVKGNDFKLKGKGKIDGAPIDLAYEGFVNSDGQAFRRKLLAEFTIDQAMREKLGVNVDMLVDGSFPVYVTHTAFNGKPSTAEVKINLTPGRVMINPFDYEKPPGEIAAASLLAVMDDGGDISQIQNLTASGPRFTLEDTTLIFRKEGEGSALSLGKISRFQIDETIAKLDFEVEPTGRIKVVLEGPFLDLRPFLNAEGDDKTASETPAMLISVAVDRMRPSDDQTVEYGKMYIDLDDQGRFNQLELDAIAGTGDVYLRYKPDETGARVFRFEADDAGATLRAFGVYDKIQGGTMVIYAEPIKHVFDRNLIGAAELRDFKVVKAPSLAKLLSAVSLPGMIGLLNNEGLGFTRLKANFNWVFRPDGSLLVLKDGRTSGNSLGLTFDGTFDNAASQIDVTGTIVPLSEINKVISKIPLVGDILTGGSGSLFAATYKIKGDAKEPTISVNPLAVLAPGILRRILFEQN
jgi:hypothetical protein